tara:strand:- start:50 stop:616 length:567 start_codon:yes stop_codon:yes gene_type:complete
MINIFPTQIGTYKLTLDEELINLVMNDYQISSIGVLNGSKSSYGITGTKFLNDERLKFLLDEIYSKLNHYTNELSLVPVDVSGSWFNQMDDGGNVKLHRHEGSVISGALYFNLSDNPSPIRFKSPLIPYKMMELYTSNSDYYQTIDVYEGLLILFPSWLEHETLPQFGNRCVISFNTLHKGTTIDNIV